MMKRIQGKSKREKIKGKEEWRELEKGKDREDDKKWREWNEMEDEEIKKDRKNEEN